MAALYVTRDNYEEQVLNSDIPVLVDFWASWCGPCQVLMPVIEELSQEVSNTKICKINVDDEPELAAKYNVMNIPTLVYLRNGEVIQTIVGVRTKNEIIDIINSL